MIKKIFFLLICFFSYSFVSAEYTCVYEATIPPRGSLDISRDVEAEIIIDSRTNQINVKKFLNFADYTTILDEKIDSAMNNEKLIEILDGGCPDEIVVCYATEIVNPGSSYATTSAIVINNTIFSKIKFPYSFSSNNILYNIPNSDQCQRGYYSDKSTGKKIEIEFPCDFIEDRIPEMESLFCKIGENGCNLSDINSYNGLKEEIATYCDQILKYQSYTNDCVMSCLKVQERINKIEGIVNNEGKCGFSWNLINWIANIVKWGKYLVPVVVIVLGILDFIKAIASDKADEMKKAQGSFVRRLIAAALIFILPFIIEFILNKMGFNANGCGIIDL